MSSKVIREWLAEYKALSDSEVHTYANTLRHNDELVTSLYEVLEQRPGVEILDPICHQLFEFFRSKELELQRFTFEFIPTLTWLYLSMVTSNEKKNCGGLEAFFLGIYNLEIVYPDGKAKTKTYRIPSLAQPSVYHEPVNLSTLALTESALARYEKTEAETWTGNQHPQYETIHGQNRQEILTYVMQCYNADIASMSPQSHQSLCQTCSRIATTGFTSLKFPNTDEVDGNLVSSSSSSFHGLYQKAEVKNGSVSQPLETRIPVSSSLLIEMLSGVYFTMFNGQSKLAGKAVEDIHHRATYELYADVLLVTNAIQNCMKYSSSMQPETAMGIGIALSPAPTTTANISKSAITNASFRATKLPDDIAVPTEENDVVNKPLPTIDEDADIPGDKGGKSSNKPSKGGRKSDKNKKERRSGSSSGVSGGETAEMTTSRSAVFNGDNSNNSGGGGPAEAGVSVVVMKNRERLLVDHVEMKEFRSKMPHSSNSVDECIMAAAAASATQDESSGDKEHGHQRYKMQSSNSLGKDMKLAQCWQSAGGADSHEA